MTQLFYQITVRLSFVALLTVGIVAAVAAQKTQPSDDDLRETRLRRVETLLAEKKAVGTSDASPSAPAADGNLDPTFNANVQTENSVAYEIAVQTDGKILVGGTFTSYNNFAQANLVRLNPDGTADSAFQPGVSGSVQTIAIQPDGKIVIGGFFTAVNGTAANRVARLNADGTLDASFNLGTGANGGVFSLAVRADGRIVLGGIFTQFNNVACQRVVLLNGDGSLDLNFNLPLINSSVYGVAVQPNGKILLTGNFTSVNQTTRRRIVRLNANGTRDDSFVIGIGLNSVGEDVAVLGDGKILVGGYFSAVNSVTRRGVARLNADGSVDAGFAPETNAVNWVNKVKSLPDGKVVIGGSLNQQFDGNAVVSLRGTMRFNADGGYDSSFDTGSDSDSAVETLAVQSDGKLWVGGAFNSFNGNTVRNIIRLNANGGVVNPAALGVGLYGLYAGGVYRIVRQPDGKVLIGGDFTHVGGVRRNGIARLNADGTLDASFNPGSAIYSFPNVIEAIFAVALQSDGKVLIGGVFDRFNGNIRANNARLNPDGSLDSSFLFSEENLGIVNDLAIQPDGKILQAGYFSPYIERLNSDGTTDFTFVGVTNGEVRRALIQGDKILLVGLFTYAHSEQRSRVARLHANGDIDLTFNPGTGADSTIYAALVQPDGKILLGGSFRNFNGAVRNHLVRLNADGTLDNDFVPATGGTTGTIYDILLSPNGGKITLGGYSTNADNSFGSGVLRLTSNGNADTSFAANVNFTVLALSRQPDAKILLGGYFSVVNGVTHNGAARLFDSSSASRTLFDFDGDGKADVSVFRPSNGAWYLQQSTSGFTGVSFGFGTDRIVPADYDGDGKTDVAVYRSGTWYLNRSQLGFTSVGFGAADDIPQPADFDGDGRAELAVFRPSNGTWYALNLLTDQFSFVQFGQNDDKPVAADYDGDGRADYAVYRNGGWYILRSSQGFIGIQFGEAADRPVPADYDGDGKADVAVFRQSNGTWYLNRSMAGFAGIQFGILTDIPAPADYDGDGKADLAVFRDGAWYLNRSTAGFTGVAFGALNDLPIPNAFVR